MREAVFNETLQLGIVRARSRGDDAEVRRRLGVGPWEVYEFDAGKAEDFREYGQPVECSWRLPDFDETVAQADRGNGVILSGEFGGARVAYLGTDRDLGVVIEISSGTAAGGRPDESGP